MRQVLSLPLVALSIWNRVPQSECWRGDLPDSTPSGISLSCTRFEGFIRSTVPRTEKRDCSKMPDVTRLLGTTNRPGEAGLGRARPGQSGSPSCDMRLKLVAPASIDFPSRPVFRSLVLAGHRWAIKFVFTTNCQPNELAARWAHSQRSGWMVCVASPNSV